MMMKYRFSLVLIAAVAIAAGWSVSSAAAQRGAATSRPARTPDGRPNLNGIWQALGTAHWDLEDHSPAAGPYYQLGAQYAIPGGQGVVEGGEIPYKPEALAKKKLNALNRLTLDPEIKCYMPGIPRANYMGFPFQIVQSPNMILMAYEFASSDRVINMGKPAEAAIDTWMGTANGRWEGDTLVVDNTGFNDQTWFDRAGNFHSNELRVIERFTLIDGDHIQYEATIEDPQTFTRPWKISMPLYRRIEKNVQLTDFKCVEYAEELLYGELRKQPSR
jgi:hypothetical protein